MNWQKQRLRIIIYGGIIFIGLFYQYGKIIWHPIYMKLKGKHTSVDIYEKHGERVTKIWRQRSKVAGLKDLPSQICLIGLKHEQSLEVWSKQKGQHVLLHRYPFTGFSGKLGPKLKSGDLQIPEGLYKISFLNPNSRFYLSMKVDYPNDFDKEVAESDGREDLGGDIFIHGKEATIGCIPIGDRAIEELYLLAYLVGIENIDVILSPNDLRTSPPLFESQDVGWITIKYKNIEKALMSFK
ncbi:MAG: hypothetical protein MK193_07235 [Lentisphaeria bacterium]|nr:hypothetical protein [Lentisphaeria bacterium]